MIGAKVHVLQIIVDDLHIDGISRAVGAWGLGVDPGAFATMLFRLLSHGDCRDSFEQWFYDDGLILPDESNSGIQKHLLTSEKSLSTTENKRVKSVAAPGKSGEINIFLTLEMPKNDAYAAT